jgi:hypothetical protein
MRVQTSTDWDSVSLPLVAQMHAAPQYTRKDLARMLGNIAGLVQRLGQEEVELRRNKKMDSLIKRELLEEIEQAIVQFEQWLVLAHLTHG